MHEFCHFFQGLVWAHEVGHFFGLADLVSVNIYPYWENRTGLDRLCFGLNLRSEWDGFWTVCCDLRTSPT